jgi:hypothetical protein
MSKRIREHLRSNVVGYVAIFLFAVGGTAYATHPGGANTISTGDIINGEVKSGDIGEFEVRAGDIAPDSLGGAKIANGSIGNVDLGAGASSSNTIADNGIQNVDIANNALTGAKVNESTLFNDNSLDGNDIADTDSLGSAEVGGLGGGDITDSSLTGDDVVDGALTDADTSGLVPYGDVLWAVVNSDGSLSRASNATTTSTLEGTGTGDYEVNFGNGGLDPCASIAQISDSGIGFDGELPGQAASARGEPTEFSIDVRTFDSAGAAADRAFTVHVLCPEGFGGAAFAASAERSRR